VANTQPNPVQAIGKNPINSYATTNNNAQQFKQRENSRVTPKNNN
jgi:hypothetical protein